MTGNNIIDTIDGLYKSEQKRKELAREVAKLDRANKAIKAKLISVMRKNGVTTISGSVGSADLDTTTVNKVSDWGALKAYIIELGCLDLLERRISKSAVADHIRENGPIDGIVSEDVTTINVSEARAIALEASV